MATIAVDIDSTLYDFETPSREAMWKRYEETGDEQYKMGAYHPWTEWRSPADSLGLEKWVEVIGLVHDSEIIRTRRPFDGAVKTCQALMREGHKLLYISNRATEAQEATYDWLMDQGFLPNGYQTDWFADVLCTNEDKQQHMRECQYLIDDRPKTILNFVYDFQWKFERMGEGQRPRKAFVVGYPYNQALSDVPNVYVSMDWYGIAHYLARKGVLSKAPVMALS
jgi:hypothetical protein